MATVVIAGSAVPIQLAHPGKSYASALGINDVGQVVGNASDGPSASIVPTIWTLTVPAPTVPDAPTGVIATAGNAQISVAFTVSASNGGSAITGYTATCGSQSASGHRKS